MTLDERDAFPQSKRPIYKRDLSVRGYRTLAVEYFMIISDKKKLRRIFHAIISRHKQVFLFGFMEQQQRKLYYICFVCTPSPTNPQRICLSNFCWKGLKPEESMKHSRSAKYTKNSNFFETLYFTISYSVLELLF